MKRILFIGVTIMVIFMANALVRSQGKLYTITSELGKKKVTIDFPNNDDTFLIEFADAYGYQPTIPNPAFDAGKPVGPSNQQTIANPQARQDFFVGKLYDWMTDIAGSGAIRKAGTAAEAAKREELKDKLPAKPASAKLPNKP